MATRSTSRRCVDVLVDSSGRLGPLSYRVPATLDVAPGDAVTVPFGQRTEHGLVLGPGDPRKATRELLCRHGVRVTPDLLGLAQLIADRHFVPLASVARRLAPTAKRNNPPVTAGNLALTDGPDATGLGYDPNVLDRQRRFLLCAPLVDQVRLAAIEAARLAEHGQVLVLCPTKEMVSDVCAQFSAGAARLDVVPTKTGPSAWAAMCDGALPVAVGTRSAALWAAGNLAGIVVVADDHPGHVEAQMPHTHARDVAALRSVASDVALTLIGSNPPAASLSAKVKVQPVGNDTHWPATTLVDRSRYSRRSRDLPGPVRAALRDAAGDPDGPRPVVVAPSRVSSRRCGRCSTERACADACEGFCAHEPATPTCERCGEERVWWRGWDRARVRDTVGDHPHIVSPSELSDITDANVVVLFDIDGLLSVPDLEPDRLITRAVLAAASAAAPDGHVFVCTSRPDESDTLRDLVEHHDQMAVARRVWEHARSEGLPPFGRLVTVRLGWAARPDVSSWPGRTFGPRRVAGDWEVLVSIPDDRLHTLAPTVDKLRRRGKVRLTVT